MMYARITTGTQYYAHRRVDCQFTTHTLPKSSFFENSLELVFSLRTDFFRFIERNAFLLNYIINMFSLYELFCRFHTNQTDRTDRTLYSVGLALSIDDYAKASAQQTTYTRYTSRLDMHCKD